MIRPINLDDEAVKVPDSMKAQDVQDANTALPIEETSWISNYYLDFKKRLLNLFGFEFRELPCSLAFQFIGEKNQNQGSTEATEDQAIIDSISREELEKHISLFDLRRLDSYSKNMVDFHLVLDLVPTLAKLFFTKQTLPRGSINLSYVQSAILIGLGLQYKKVEDIEKDLGLNSSQILPQFNKVMRKFTRVIKSVIERDIEKTIDEESKANQDKARKQIASTGMQNSLDDDLEEGDTKLLK
jgi:N-acetyltransferase 10